MTTFYFGRKTAAAILGRSTSPAKAEAARTNGRKGGRPTAAGLAQKVVGTSLADTFSLFFGD